MGSFFGVYTSISLEEHINLYSIVLGDNTRNLLTLYSCSCNTREMAVKFVDWNLVCSKHSVFNTFFVFSSQLSHTGMWTRRHWECFAICKLQHAGVIKTHTLVVVDFGIPREPAYGWKVSGTSSSWSLNHSFYILVYVSVYVCSVFLKKKISVLLKDRIFFGMRWSFRRQRDVMVTSSILKFGW
jgi:hypothetical protein